jgi:hypothetical protein
VKQINKEKKNKAKKINKQKNKHKKNKHTKKLYFFMNLLLQAFFEVF